MPKSEDQQAANKPAPQNAMLQMIATMADTTWRMFVPILGLLVVGILIDKSNGSFPWVTLLGFAFGIFISALLIRSQFKKGAK